MSQNTERIKMSDDLPDKWIRQDERLDELPGRLCSKCSVELPRAWKYQLCERCGELDEYDFAEDDRQFDARREQG